MSVIGSEIKSWDGRTILVSKILATTVRGDLPAALDGQPYEPTVEDLAFYERAGGKPRDQFHKGHGCSVCSGTGYVGRIGVYEVLQVTNEMRELVVRNASVDEIRKLAVEQGMVPMRDQALRLVADDVTTVAEVMRTIYIL